ncbi:hypothetical protein AB0K51_19515 [Kitasatospora sp. NPDC049285]|uniref:hypothetical protein n=1 Tax=Kitasatospora sp. NPDC049285 TaxID=3157096 RepID=UPI003443B64F
MAETREHPCLAPLPGEEPRHRPCGTCGRCVSGTGRDRNPNTTDCYDDYLTAATTWRSA